MRPTQHVLVSIAGALAFGAAGATYCAMAERAYEAAAPVAIVSGRAGMAVIDLGAARSIIAAEPILRRTALRPEAAAAIERHARPTPLSRLLSLFAARTGDADTLSRAVAFLASRVDARAGPWPDMIELVARMPAPNDAASVATALAESFVADLNETALAARRRSAEKRSERLDRAARALDEAHAKTLALRATDPLQVASIAPKSATPEAAGDAIDRLKRDASDATARLAAATQIYGPRHPELIRIGNDARKARGALETATRTAKAHVSAPVAAKEPPAEGGPDPRALEIAAAEDEAAQAQAAYDLEMSRNETDRREARVLKPAPAPAISQGLSSAWVVGVSALGGFLLFGAAPGLASARPRARPRIRDWQAARLRGTAFSPAQARRALAALDLGEGSDARRIAVAAEDARDAACVARALAVAALSAGWRPLLVAEGRGRDGRPARLDGRPIAIHASPTRFGPLHIATPATAARSKQRPLDAERAYDLVVFPTPGRSGLRRPRIDRLLRVATDLSSEQTTLACKDMSCDAAAFAGTIVYGRSH